MTFRKHPSFIPPEEREYKIWRYMDFTKFVSMLARQSLYFTNLQKISKQDPFEGMLPDTYYQCRSWKTVEEIPEQERWRLTLHPHPGLTQLEMAKRSMEEFASIVSSMRKTLYVNCWHMSDYDSAAMWSIYASRGSGIAITSDYLALQASLQSDKSLFAGKIIYSDYSTEIIDTLNIPMTLAMRKRRSFDFEREFRIMFWDDSIAAKPGGLQELAEAAGRDGLECSCDLSTLVDKIYVSPNSAGWFLELVQSVVKTYGLNKEVLRSALDTSPMV